MRSDSDTAYYLSWLSTIEKRTYLTQQLTRHISLASLSSDPPVCLIRRFEQDRDILEHICYDFNDEGMMELLRPSLEEAMSIQSQTVALDWIGRRGTTVGATKAKRIKYAQEILQKEMLPHVGKEEGLEVKKAYFFGYIINSLLSTVLGRREFDDRDHYGNKRLDLAGPLLGNLFRQLFAKMRKETNLYLRKKVEEGREFNLHFAVKGDIISRGLKYSLATGNWSAERKGPQIHHHYHTFEPTRHTISNTRIFQHQQ